MDCHQCKYYHVTWDKQFPYGCRAMKFKSYTFPSAVVRQSSGSDCLMFELKIKGQRSRVTKHAGKKPREN